MAQRVSRGVIGAFAEIDATDIFAPADDLADEPVDRVQRSGTFDPGPLGGLADLERSKGACVQMRRKKRMVEEALVGEHRILTVAEL